MTPVLTCEELCVVMVLGTFLLKYGTTSGGLFTLLCNLL